MLRLALVLAIGLATTAVGALAERAPAPPQPLPAAATGPGAARVIVKFKDDASVLRAHALAAGASPSTLALTLQARAGALGARHGVALRSGAALAEREQVLHGPPGWSSAALAERLAGDADVLYAEPDRRMRRRLVPNDPLFANVAGSQGPAVGQWYLRAPAGEVASSIDAVRAWDITTGDANVIVAVLDTGVRPDHPDLAGKLVAGYDMIDDATISNDGNGRDNDPSDPGDWLTQSEINAGAQGDPSFWSGCEALPSSWHGTMVSGIIAAATGNGAGMAGAGWNVRVMPVRVLGKCFGYTSDIIAGMRWAAGIAVPGLPANPNPARVVNLSLGSGDTCSAAERSAIADINARGAVLVAAAGNSAGRAASSPANCPGAIGVAAVRHVGSKVGFSDVGPELAIAAPGGNCVNIGASEPCLYPILTTIDSGTFAPASATYTDSFNVSVGTSFSSPLVAATAALMFSAQPALTPAGVKAALQAGARPFPASDLTDASSGAPLQACRAPGNSDQLECYCTPTTCGAGMLDAGAAVAASLGLRAAISVSPAAPLAGQLVTLASNGSTVASGRTIAQREWALVDGGSIVSGFVGASNQASASVQPSAGGQFSVRLTITDDHGTAVSVVQTIAVAAAPGAIASAGSGNGSGGGGAMAAGWLLALAAAALLLLLQWPVSAYYRKSPSCKK